MNINLTDYIPDIKDIPTDKVSDVITRLRTIMALEWPEINTTPNSVVGDLVIRPLAYLVAAFEIGAGRAFSDLDLANVASGEIWNCDFVRQYLKNLGIHERMAVPVIGTVRLAFQTNKSYTIDRGSRILFNNNLVFNFLAPYPGPIIIGGTGATPQKGNWKELTQIDENVFVVDLTVVGPADSSIEADTEALTDIPDPELASITSVGDFTPGVIPEDVPQLAALARKIFHSATLTTRNGTVSFIYRQFPNVVGVSPTMSGDDEMQRDKQNILGVAEGRVDVHIRSLNTLLQESVNVTLVKDGNKFKGLLNLPQVPLYIDSVAADNYKIVSTSKNRDRAVNLSCTYSNLEALGLIVEDDLPTSPATNTVVSPEGVTDILVNGSYVGGGLFSAAYSRLIEFTLTSDSSGVLRDLINGDSDPAVVVFDSTDNEVTVSGVSNPKYLNGIEVTISDPLNYVGNPIVLELKAETASVPVTYRYDRMISEVEDVISSPDIQSVVDILTKGFTTCYVSNLSVKYRRPPGKFVDREKAKDAIYKYVNCLGYPEIYEQSAVADIMLWAGASGVQAITESGVIYPTQATHMSPDGSDNESNFIETPSVTISPLLDDSTFPLDLKNINSYTYLRNINYIIDRENITLTEIKY